MYTSYVGCSFMSKKNPPNSMFFNRMRAFAKNAETAEFICTACILLKPSSKKEVGKICLCLVTLFFCNFVHDVRFFMYVTCLTNLGHQQTFRKKLST